MMLQAAAFLGVLVAAAYLVFLGIGALVQPVRTAAFLGRFAQTLPAHLLELVVRLIIGAALVVRAPFMHLTTWIAAFGWLLIASSLVLAVLPWRLHQRFARWSVPQAARRLGLIGVGSTLAGLALLSALMLPRAAS